MVAPLSAESCGCPFQDIGASTANSANCNGTLLFLAVLEQFLVGRCDIADPCGRVVGVSSAWDEYDYVVVGAGAGGPVTARRLSEDPDVNVLIIEAGGPDPIASRVPSFYGAYAGNPEVDWMYRTQPDNYCLSDSRPGCTWPRGKTLGGCTVLNGMMYIRGHVADYEDWVNFGATGWSWEDNFPYFLKSEDNKQIGSLVSEEFHASGGLMPVQRFKNQSPMVYDLMKAINESGLPLIDDMNNPNTPEGFTIAQTFSNDGQRFSAARAFLQPEWVRPNLHTLVHAQVTRVLFDGNRAYGVEYIRNGETKTVRAKKEVILSAGALNSAHILLLSGVGPREQLEKFNIPVVADLPVGQNLRNHLGATFSMLLTKRENVETLDWVQASEYLLNREGAMTSTGNTQLSGMLYSSLADRERSQPDLQFFFGGYAATCSATGEVGEPIGPNPDQGATFSITACSLLPRSVGYLELNSTDPTVPPLFYPQYFHDPADMIMVKDGARYVKQIMESPTLQDKYGVKLDPSSTSACDSTGEQWSDEWLECMIRTYTDPQNHQLGTNAISRVVDLRLRVYNTTNLRVIDASVMPTAPTSNPQAVIMMVAERGADMIKEDNRQS